MTTGVSTSYQVFEPGVFGNGYFSPDSPTVIQAVRQHWICFFCCTPNDMEEACCDGCNAPRFLAIQWECR